ncbi:hypothetical protein Tco_0393231 [Tanacetum coccineum]
MNEGLQAFMDRFKSESSHIKSVPLVLRISAFMHRHEHPELAKKLNDKIPKRVDEMFERVRAFIRRKATTGSAKVAKAPQWDKGATRLGWSKGEERVRGRSGPKEFQRKMGTCAPYSRRNTFTPLTKTPKDILAMEGHNTNDCFHLKKQIEEVMASGKLAHLVKDIRQGNYRNGSQG